MTESFRSTLPQRNDFDLIDSDRAFDLLKSGVPLTLLLDLATPIHSAEVYEHEAGQADWLHAVVA
jgi:hypothetical protein